MKAKLTPHGETRFLDSLADDGLIRADGKVFMPYDSIHMEILIDGVNVYFNHGIDTVATLHHNAIIDVGGSVILHDLEGRMRVYIE